jgi:tRNA threonylcarbamoyladenosine biosynthesis protein TsaE
LPPTSQNPNRRSWDSSDPLDTARLAAAVAELLVPGDVVWLRGEMGSGKTTFIQAACRRLGVRQAVSSPTYTVGNRYSSASGPVAHLDLYRSRGLTFEEWVDLEPYFDDAIAFVEWPDAGAALLPPPRLLVDIEIGEGDARLITIRCDDQAVFDRLAGALP